MATSIESRIIRRGIDRPKPEDFRELFVKIGWATVDHYGTGWLAVSRWIEQEGSHELRQDRRAYVETVSLRNRIKRALSRAPSIPPTLGLNLVSMADRYANQIAKKKESRLYR